MNKRIPHLGVLPLNSQNNKPMKLLITACAALISTLLFAQSDTTKATSQIESVIVYFQGAHISRKAKVKLPAGKQTLVLTGVTGQLNPARIEVKGGSGLTILSVNHRLQKPENELNEKARKKSESQIKSLENRIKILLNRESVFGTEERLLMENMNFQSKTSGATVTEIREAANFYRARLNEIGTAKLDIANQLDQVRDSVRMINQNMSKISAGANILQSEKKLMKSIRIYTDWQRKLCTTKIGKLVHSHPY